MYFSQTETDYTGATKSFTVSTFIFIELIIELLAKSIAALDFQSN